MAATGTPWLKLFSQMPRHPKIIGLSARSGKTVTQVIGHMIQLWCWAVDFAPDGDLSGLQWDYIGIAMGLQRHRSRFIRDCIGIGLLDETEDGLFIHDWMDYAESYKRAETQKNKRIRASKKGSPVPVQYQHSTDSVLLSGEERSGAEQRGEDLVEKAARSKKGKEKKKDKFDPVIDEILDYHKSKLPDDHPEYTPTNGDRSKIRARLKEGIGLDECKKAIDGALLSPWHNGEEKGVYYLGIRTLFWDANKVRGFGQMTSPKQLKKDPKIGWHPGSRPEEFSGNDDVQL